MFFLFSHNWYLCIKICRIKALVSFPPTPATPRPVKVTLPPVNFTAIAGKYNNNGYGSVELCLVSPKNPTASRSCQDLASNISTILPGVVNPKIPTFVAEWHSPWASHLSFMHFNGNTFNVSAFTSYVSSISLCIPLPH
jgi:hypothetical protein